MNGDVRNKEGHQSGGGWKEGQQFLFKLFFS